MCKKQVSGGEPVLLVFPFNLVCTDFCRDSQTPQLTPLEGRDAEENSMFTGGLSFVFTITLQRLGVLCALLHPLYLVYREETNPELYFHT